jgi:hypothetical protein
MLAVLVLLVVLIIWLLPILWRSIAGVVRGLSLPRTPAKIPG